GVATELMHHVAGTCNLQGVRRAQRLIVTDKGSSSRVVEPTLPAALAMNLAVVGIAVEVVRPDSVRHRLHGEVVIVDRCCSVGIDVNNGEVQRTATANLLGPGAGVE